MQTPQTLNPQTANMPSEKPNPPVRKKRWLRVFVLFVLCLLLTLFALLGWITGTESGLRFGLYKIPSWFGVNISSKTLRGTLLGGFSGDEWKIETEGADVMLSRFKLAWQPKELTNPRLHINELSAGDVVVITKPTPPKESTPTIFPSSVSLPVEAAIDRLETGKISVGKSLDKLTVYVEKIQTAYRYNHNEHRLELLSVDSPWSHSAGAVVLGTQSPFALNTAIYTKGELEGETVHGNIRLWGSLRDMQTNLSLDGNNVHLFAKSIVHPFAESLDKAVDDVQMKGFHVNPTAFLPSLPKARLDFDAVLVPSFTKGLALEGSIDLGNTAAGFADDNSIPVRTILSEFTVDNNGVITLKDSEITLLNKGSVDVSGTIDTAANTLNLALGVNELGADDAVQQQIAGRLNGSINVKGQSGSPDIDWNLDSGFAKTNGVLHIVSDAANGQRTLKLDKIQVLPEGGGDLTASGTLELFKDQLLKVDVLSKGFNPGQIDPQLPKGSVNGTIALNGKLTQKEYGAVVKFTPSMLNGVALSGSADVMYAKSHLTRAMTDIRLGSNVIKTDGSLGKKGDRLNINIASPDLSRFGFGLGGSLNTRGYIAGDLSDGIKSLESDLSGQVRAFKFGSQVNIRNLDFTLKGSPDVSKPLDSSIRGEQIVLDSSTTIDAVNLFINGTGLRHRIRGGSSMALDGKHYKLEIDADGGVNQDQTQWKGMLNALDISGAFNLKLQNRISLEAGAERVALGAAHWSAMGGSLNLQNFVWDKKEGIVTKGAAQNLHMEQLHNLYTPPVQHNLVLSGDWDLAYAQNARGYLNLNRQAGDIVIDDTKKLTLGLTALSLRGRFQDGRIDAVLDGNTRFGKVSANAGINQRFGNQITEAPLSGKVKINVPDLEAIRVFLPSNAQKLSGDAVLEADLGGRIGSPAISSFINSNTNYGKIGGTVNIAQSSDFMNAPLSGQIGITVPSLEEIRNFLPVGQTVKGNLKAVVTLGGRLNAPELNGVLNGDQLYYRNQTQGIVLDNGILRSRLQGRRWVIDSLKFHRGGTVELKGTVALDETNPDVNVNIVFDHYRTLSRPNRRLQLSGATKLLYHPNKGVVLDGNLRADFGLFGFQNSSMPTLDDDVVVLGEEKKVQAAATPIYMDLNIDLNNSVRFIADGLNVTLGGSLKLTSRPGESIQGVGSVNVVKGRYKAYGQDLEITKGTISFVGPLANPNLDIRAKRRMSPVDAGVEVLGNVESPRVTLVANEAMSEKDKLSWLILNRASSGSAGDEAALSAAASALLVGQINDRIGLVDDFGFSSQASRNRQTGELNPAEQVLTVGKQLTSELYLGYEYGLTSSSQTVKLIYQLSKAIQAVLKIGSLSSGVELKRTVRFDHWFGDKDTDK